MNDKEIVNKPYIKKIKVVINKEYNPQYGDNRICECGHPYYRHFDTYDDMSPCGCKYCNCDEFKEKNNNIGGIINGL